MKSLEPRLKRDIPSVIQRNSWRTFFVITRISSDTYSLSSGFTKQSFQDKFWIITFKPQIPFSWTFYKLYNKKFLKKTHKQTSQPSLVTLFCSKTSKRLKNCGLLTCRFSDFAFHHLMMDWKIILEPQWQQ